MKITKQQRNIVLAMSLGDGQINCRYLRICQCSAQKKYVEWKRNLLIKNGIDVNEMKEFDNSGFVAYKFTTKSYEFIGQMRRYLYTPKKVITRKTLDALTPLGIAIWYMDDGGLSKKKRNGKIHANDLMLNTGLQKAENQIIIDYFSDIWGVRFSQVKNNSVYRLRCGTIEARKFINIVRPYVKEVGCFDYKIDIKD